MSPAPLSVDELATVTCGPLMVGNQVIESKHIDKIAAHRETGRLLSPRDCIKDRRVAFNYWGDE